MRTLIAKTESDREKKIEELIYDFKKDDDPVKITYEFDPRSGDRITKFGISESLYYRISDFM